MSVGSRWAIGVVALLGAACVWYLVYITAVTGFEPPSQIAIYCGIGIFTTALGVACLVPSSWPVTLRVVGGLLVVQAAWMLYQDLTDPQADARQMWRGIGFFLVVGLPGGYVAIFGAYPIWGLYARVLRGER